MRLIATCPIEKLKLVKTFAAYCHENSIGIQIEVHNQDVEIWALNEDRIDKTKEAFEEFIDNPKLKKYKVVEKEAIEPEKTSRALQPQKLKQQDFIDPHKIPPVAVQTTNPILTKIFVGICVFFYLLGLFESFSSKKSSRTMASMILTPSQQNLIFDYPLTLALINEFAINFGDEAKGKESDFSPQAQALLDKIGKTPYFQGFYKALVNYNKFDTYWGGQKFKDIASGQIWRLVTPTFLHASLLHILFNMLWLLMLGRMIEANLSKGGYFFLTLFLAMSTNVLQYLMTGPLFMGYSGVVTGLAGFIWARQGKAPNEIYPIERKVLRFLGIFVFGLLALQIILFILQILHVLEFNMQIANTAHVSGVVLGYIVGKIKPGMIKKNDS